MTDAAIATEAGTQVQASPQPSRLYIGPLPWPVYAAAVAVSAVAVWSGNLPNDVIGGLSVLMLLGFLLGKLGQTIPVLKQVGGTAILCLFVPAAIVGYGLMPEAALKAISTTFRTANFQYFYIACLVTGSILGMPRRVLVQGFIRMFVPLLVGTLAAIAAGILVGLAFGHSPRETFFFIVMPIVGGGLAEGVLPLSIGYSEILGRPQGELVAQMVPAAILGNVVAIVGAGLLARLGDVWPHLSGQGMLVRTGDDDLLREDGARGAIELPLLGCGIVLSSALFILGMVLAPYTGIPGPIIMIISATALKLSKLLSADMERGAYQINRFMSTNLTFAILVAMGTLLVSWKQLVASITPGYILICTASVLSMIASGFFVGRKLNMFPVEAGIVTACHSGLGGTGDVAILGAANRMGLMAFAQTATRVGGAIMIVIATFLMKAF